jgi:ribosomal protein L9
MIFFNRTFVVSFFIVSELLLAGAKQTAIGASFVPPAAPSVTGSTPAPTAITFARNQAVSNGYGSYSSAGTVLKAKKNSPSAPAAKKVQVKLLKHVAGTGQAGDVIQVAPAFFNNKLRPTKSAELISDEEAEKERSEQEEMEKEMKDTAIELQSKLSETTLSLSRKAGPDGQLFGGIGPKIITSELKKIFGGDFLSLKGVKIAEIIDEGGKKVRGDIKHTGKFEARIVLMKDISEKIVISVEAE